MAANEHTLRGSKDVLRVICAENMNVWATLFSRKTRRHNEAQCQNYSKLARHTLPQGCQRSIFAARASQEGR